MEKRRSPLVFAFGLVLAAAACGAISLPMAKLPRDYDLLFSPQAHAFRFAQSPEPVRRGAFSERYELRDGDCGGSDCSNPRYRSEIQDTASKARVGKDIWYGWSFRNQTIPTFTPRNALRIVLGQWKLSGGTRPAFRLIQTGVGEGNWSNCDPTICRPTNDTREDVVMELADMANQRGWGDKQNNGQICKLFSMKDASHQWMDIVVNTNFSAGADGYLRVWVNGVQKCDYHGQIVATYDGAMNDRPNTRRGIFASYTARWDASESNRQKPTLIAYYDEFRQGKSREDVDTRLREQIGHRPND